MQSPNETLALGGTSVYHCINSALCNAFGWRQCNVIFFLFLNRNNNWY